MGENKATRTTEEGGPGPGNAKDTHYNTKSGVICQAVLEAIQGRSGEIRIECPNCQGEGSQEKTLGVNADTGVYSCFRCPIKGNVKRQEYVKKPFAEWVWDHGIPCKKHPYTDRKKISAKGLRTNNFNGEIQLIVPYYKDGKISTCQTITNSGSKKFLPKHKGCEIKGASYTIQGQGDTIYIGEGYATMASIHEATGCTVVCVGGKSNFISSSENIQSQFNGSSIVFCADNDKDGGGLKYAAMAAKKFKGKVVMPKKVGQDFNDVLVEGGADAVKDQLKKYINLDQKALDEIEDATPEMVARGISKEDIIEAAYSGQRGASNLFIETFKNTHAFDRAAGLWYQFTGNYWEVDKRGEPIRDCDIVQGYFKKVSLSLSGDIKKIDLELSATTDSVKKEELEAKLAELNGQRKAVNTTDSNLDNLHYRKQVIDFATYGSDSLGITGEEWDQLPWSLAVENGIIDLKTGQIKKGKPTDYIKSFCPTIFDKKANCPNFERFLLEILENDIELLMFLQRLLGAALIGDGTFKQFIAIFSGMGRNGKDTLMGIIQHVLGLDLAAPLPAELILDGGPGGKRSSQGPSADMMKLRGLRFAYVNETSQGRKFNTGVVKSLSGGGLMTARPPYGRANVDWNQTHMLFLMTNHKPQAPVDDYAFWKRIKTIHFPLSFVSDPTEPHERKADIKLGEKLKQEAPGILNFLIYGCLEYQQYGLSEPQAVKAANLQYLKDVDQTGLFIDECCLIDHNVTVTAKAFYAAYKSWAQENNLRAVSGRAFGLYVSGRFEKGRDLKGIIYKGVGILEN